MTPSIMAEPTTVARKQMGTLALKIREPSVTSVTANSCSKGVTYGEARLTMARVRLRFRLGLGVGVSW